MQEKRIGKRLVLLSWDRYQQLLAAEQTLKKFNAISEIVDGTVRAQMKAYKERCEATKAVGSK